LFKDFKHYADFLNAEEGISTNILAARLNSLESEGMLRKLADPEHGARYIYRPTRKCLELIPAMLEIIEWSEKWDDNTGVPSDFIAEIRSDRIAFAKRLIAQFEES